MLAVHSPHQFDRAGFDLADCVLDPRRAGSALDEHDVILIVDVQRDLSRQHDLQLALSGPARSDDARAARRQGMRFENRIEVQNLDAAFAR